MDIAIVTGASSSLGLAISRRLIQLGFRVYGLGGDYTDCDLRNVNFRPMSCDLADPSAIESCCARILEAEKGVYVVVNNAKYFGRQPFMEMTHSELERILRINLLCPLVLARTLGQSLMTLQGYFIQLGPPDADASRGGPAGAAASGGLKWMGEVLFQEMREYGVKVSHLSPEPNRTREARNAARPGARTEAVIDPEAVAQAVEQILQSQFGNIITELVLRPLRIREPDQDPVVRLPYPEPKPVPYTVPREMIEAEEQLEDEEYARKQRRRKSDRSDRSDKSDKSDRSDRSDKSDRSDRSDRSDKPRRRSRRKPRPPKAEVGFLDRAKGESEASKPAEKRSDPQPLGQVNEPEGPQPLKEVKDSVKESSDGPEAAPRKAARKAPRKAAKKATKKAAAKKTAAKKATARKAATKKTATRKAAKKAAAKKAPRKKAARKNVEEGPVPPAGTSESD